MMKTGKFLIVFILLTLNLFALSIEDAKVLLKLKVDSQKITKNILLISMDMDYDTNKAELDKTVKSLKAEIEASSNQTIKNLWQNYQIPINLATNDDVDVSMIKKLDGANQALYKSLKKLDTQIDGTKLVKENIVANQIVRSERIANSFIHLYRSYKSEKSINEIDKFLTKYDEVMTKEMGSLTTAQAEWQRVKPLLHQALELRDVELVTIVKECNKLTDIMKKNLHFKLPNIENNATDLSTFLNEVAEKNSKKAYYINTLSFQTNRVQMMIKNVLLVLLGVEKETNKKRALAIASTFNNTLTKLLNDKRDLKIQKELLNIKSNWYFFNNNLQSALKGDKDSILFVLEKSDYLSKLNQLTLKNFQKRNFVAKEAECLMVQKVNLAGKLRYLTQKMIKEKILIVGGLETTKNKKRLSNSIASFDTIINAFFKGNTNLKIRAIENTLAKTQLNSINSTWKNIKPQYLKNGISDSDLTKLIKKNEGFMSKVNSLVTLFVNEIDY